MIKLLMERDRPPTFNLASDKEVAWHARISVNAIAELAGRYHWLCTYATEEKLFSVIVVDDEATYDAWVKKTNAYTAGLKIRRIVRVLDPSLAEERSDRSSTKPNRHHRRWTSTCPIHDDDQYMRLKLAATVRLLAVLPAFTLPCRRVWQRQCLHERGRRVLDPRSCALQAEIRAAQEYWATA
jgi:hypothetical protein